MAASREKERRAGAGRSGLSQIPKTRLRAWLSRHLQVLVSSLGQLVRAPLGTLMTGGVIGIALGLYVLLENFQTVSRDWDGSAQISLFLAPAMSDADAREMAEELGRRPELDRVRVITRGEALDEYRRLSGFNDVLDALGAENPLPAVLVLHPAPSHSGPAAIQNLLHELERRGDVEIAQYDLQWLKRLYAIMEIVQRGILVVAALLALGVMLIVGNTIRLSIQNRREEIEIAKLCGATDAFIRRPFLYTGLWFGLLGGVVAWTLVAASFELLRRPVGDLAALYYSDFLLVSIDAQTTIGLLGTGAALGLIGSWLAVGRHLDAIEPS